MKDEPERTKESARPGGGVMSSFILHPSSFLLKEYVVDQPRSPELDGQGQEGRALQPLARGERLCVDHRGVLRKGCRPSASLF